MNGKVVALFLGLCIMVAAFAYVFTNNINDVFSVRKAENDLNIVKVNDIMKNSQSFLEDKNEARLLRIVEQNGFDLVLYNTDGYIIFDNKNKDNLGKKDNINKVLSESGYYKKVSIVNPYNSNSREIAIAVVDTKQKKAERDELRERAIETIRIFCIVFIVLSFFIFLLLYHYLLHPFKKLEKFAGEVAKGNLDIPLVFSRHNLFGAFTWAFDMMRNELKTSKEQQAETERTKKELVAALSHDIRTPIASIKAYAECLKSLPEKNSQRGDRYIDVIIRKTDEITKLSQDMFLHALSDLEKLEIEPGEYRSRDLLNNIIEPLKLQYENRIIIPSAFPEVNIFTDKLRLAQVFENIISNSAKYSQGSDIQIEAYMSEGMLKCCFKDTGSGVLPEDIPFLFDKFYRGKNAKESGQPGSGLGLFISKYILEKTGGQIKAYNYSENGESGFIVEVFLKIQ